MPNDAQLDIVIKMHDMFSKEFQKLTGKMARESKKAERQAKRSFTSIAASTKKMGKSFAAAAVGIKGLVGYLAASAMVRGAKNLALTAAKSEDLSRAFGNLTKSAGLVTEDALMAMNSGLKGTVDEMEMMRLANNALLLDVVKSEQELADLAEAGRRLGKAMGIDAAKGFESLVVGIGRQSKLWLDNLGIIIKVEKAYEDYAMAVGKLVEELTDEERKQAFIKATHRAMEKRLAALGEDIESSAEAYGRLGAAASKAWTEISKIFNPTNVKIANALTDALKWVAKTASTEPDLETRVYEQRRREVHKRIVALPYGNKQYTSPLGGSGAYNEHSLRRGFPLDELLDMYKKFKAESDKIKYMREGGFEKELFNMDRDFVKHLWSPNVKLPPDIIEGKKRSVGDELIPFLQQRARPEGSYDLYGELSRQADVVNTKTKTLFQTMAQGVKYYTEQTGTVLEQFSFATSDMFMSLEDSIGTVFFDAMKGKMKSFKEYVASFVNDITRILSQMFARQAITGLLGAFGFAAPGSNAGGGTAVIGAGVSGGTTTSFGFDPMVGLKGPFAKGGITSGPSIAGEAGPEAVVPLPDGRTIPVSMKGDAGKVVNVNFHIRTNDGASFNASLVQSQDIITKILQRAMGSDAQLRASVRAV